MARFIWKEGSVVSLRIKNGEYLLAQLLRSPYLAFFPTFQKSDDWPPDALEGLKPLFFCAVTRQFLAYSPLLRQAKVRPKAFRSLPIHWIKEFTGSRRVTVWQGTKQERSVLMLHDRPGGQLIEKHLDAVGFEDWPVIKRSIALDDHKTIDKHEMNCIWTFPLLNERLLLCRILGQCVDPCKDITFDRALKPEYRTYVDMLACHGTLEDWGYVVPPKTASKKKAGARRK